VVGTGVQAGAHLTVEARIAVERADIVLYLMADAVATAWIAQLNPRTRSLQRHYLPAGRPRTDTYAAISDEILEHVRDGLDVCVALYGHPGIFVAPSHDAIARARAEGFQTRLLPAVSAEDCLFADLGVDPGLTGWQSYEATGFLLGRKRPDSSAALVLWQLGTVGNALATQEAAPVALGELVAALLETYPAEHEVVVYEAAAYPGFNPLIRRIPLGELSPEHVTAMATLYVPPLPAPS